MCASGTENEILFEKDCIGKPAQQLHWQKGEQSSILPTGGLDVCMAFIEVSSFEYAASVSEQGIQLSTKTRTAIINPIKRMAAKVIRKGDYNKK